MSHSLTMKVFCWLKLLRSKLSKRLSVKINVSFTFLRQSWMLFIAVSISSPSVMVLLYSTYWSMSWISDPALSFSMRYAAYFFLSAYARAATYCSFLWRSRWAASESSWAFLFLSSSYFCFAYLSRAAWASCSAFSLAACASASAFNLLAAAAFLSASSLAYSSFCCCCLRSSSFCLLIFSYAYLFSLSAFALAYLSSSCFLLLLSSYSFLFYCSLNRVSSCLRISSIPT